MATTKAHDINALGQSIWYDNIRRLFLENGEIARLIEAGVLGMTSNPTIFEKAIAGSTDYDADMRRLVEAGETPNAIYEALAVGDIRRAADLLQPVYEETNGVDGYISLEVNPLLAHDTEGTIREAQRLFALVGRPNVMIKVPATPEGIPAIATLIAGGININVTLIFALDKYREVMDAYLAGLEKRLAVGGDLTRIASVASFFVSRVDSAVDKLLAAKGNTDLQGKVAIANAKVAYALFQTVFSGTRWAKLTEAGARVQRPLWASTGTKNPAYPDTHYVDTLIGPDTVNTMPPATLEATLDHGVPAATIMQGMDTAHAQLAQLGALGIDIDGVTQTLLEEGVEAFKKSFESLMGSITVKRRHLIAEIQGRSAVLGMYEGAVAAALERMDTERIPARITLKDHTVWGSDPAEISNRLGWLDSPTVMKPVTDAIYDIADEVWSDGITKALVLGMGGSSLAPEVFAKTFGVNTAHLELGVLDSTDADTVRDFAYRFPPEDTLYIVSSKSGGTVEMVSFFRYFYNLTAETFGAENKAKIGEHFIAITDPGSGLQKMAEDYLFRSVFLNDPNIGGRYSALSYFGLFPAALDGVDLYKLLDRASLMVDRCGATLPAADNYGAWLGAILGVLATQGRDKATFILSPTIASFGDWVEQLIAESTGKNGKGILPVVGESVGAPEVYGTDRAFFYLKTAGDSTHDAAVDALQAAGHPVIRLHLSDPYDLGGMYYLWEYAVAAAGWVLSIQPFDQPNVESAKILARQMVATYREQGTLPTQTAILTEGKIAVYGNVSGATVSEAFQAFGRLAKAGDYMAIQAYVNPTEYRVAETLEKLRNTLRDHTKLPVTLGYGPRFLHSTGQLHKGDGNNGLFVILTSDPLQDAAIPDEAGATTAALSFGVLKLAQALGDMQALVANGRRVIRFHLGNDVLGGIKALMGGM